MLRSHRICSECYKIQTFHLSSINKKKCFQIHQDIFIHFISHINNLIKRKWGHFSVDKLLKYRNSWQSWSRRRPRLLENQNKITEIWERGSSDVTYESAGWPLALSRGPLTFPLGICMSGKAVNHRPDAMKLKKLLKSQTWLQTYVLQTSGGDQQRLRGTRTLWYSIRLDTSACARPFCLTSFACTPRTQWKHEVGDKQSFAINIKSALRAWGEPKKTRREGWQVEHRK